MKWMNYQHLFYFFNIAKEGSISKAAARLRLGQSALSIQLKQLEQALGYQLFERKGRSLQLTDKGTVVFSYASEIFRLGSEMLEAAADRLSEKRIHLQIGAMDSLPKRSLYRLVDAAYRRGDCYVSVLEDDGERLFRDLKAHRLDLVLTNSPPRVGPTHQLYSRQVANMPVIVCGADKYMHLRKGFPRSLEGQPLVLPTAHSKLRQDIDHFFEVQGVRVRSIGETQDGEVQKLIALSGHALIPIALPAVEEQLKAKSLVRIGTLENVTEQLWLTSAERRIKNPLAQELITNFSLEKY